MSKTRLIQAVDKNILKDVDGFYYYAPSGIGLRTSYNLREIADELDRRNKDWEDYINNYLEKDNER